MWTPTCRCASTTRRAAADRHTAATTGSPPDNATDSVRGQIPAQLRRPGDRHRAPRKRNPELNRRARQGRTLHERQFARHPGGHPEPAHGGGPAETGRAETTANNSSNGNIIVQEIESRYMPPQSAAEGLRGSADVRNGDNPGTCGNLVFLLVGRTRPGRFRCGRSVVVDLSSGLCQAWTDFARHRARSSRRCRNPELLSSDPLFAAASVRNEESPAGPDRQRAGPTIRRRQGGGSPIRRVNRQRKRVREPWLS